MKKTACAVVFMYLLCCLTGCGADNAFDNVADIGMKEETTESLLQQTEGAETIVQTEAQTKEWGRFRLHGIAILTRKRL